MGAALLAMLVLAAPPVEARPEEGNLIWTCPDHRELTESESGRCSLCGKELVPAWIEEAWSCPVHTMVAEPSPGRCELCGRELYPITREVSYSCPMHSEVRQVEAGICPLCRMALVPASRERPHQDHNPKHGGIFFMAPDAWHHLEGSYPEEGVLRVHLYDNYSRPMNAKAFQGRAVLKEVYDRSTRQARELLAYPLLPSRDGEYLEARVGTEALPREISAKIQFLREGPFERFDFVFAEISRAESANLSTAAEPELVVPDSPQAIAASILEREERVRELIDKGAFNQIYLPALEAKDLALALETHLPASREDRVSIEWAVKELVRSAWLLDDFGDLGNREKVGSAFQLFQEAARAIAAGYGVER